MINMKRTIFIFVILLSTIFTVSYASNVVDCSLNKEYQIYFNESAKSFYNAKGEEVYPILYDNTNYLPIRAVSSLFNIPIRWGEISKTIYLGDGEVDLLASKTENKTNKDKNINITAVENQVIKVVFNGKTQEFRKSVGDYSVKIYPLSYEGTTYLPLRNLTELFGGTIEWNGSNKIIKIQAQETLPDKDTNRVSDNDVGVFNNGDDFVMYNANLYFRKYEPQDYEQVIVGQIKHNIKQSSGDRAIVKYDWATKDTPILFYNDSVGKFYMADDKFFFRNNTDIYATNLKGENRVSFGKAEWKSFDAKNHKMEIKKSDGIYEVNTQTLEIKKTANLHYEYTLNMIVDKFFHDDFKYNELYKNDEYIYYYNINAPMFDIYCFDYATEDNKKLASISKDIEVYKDYIEEALYVDYISLYNNKLYVYVSRVKGTAGTTAGNFYCINEDGSVTKLVSNDFGFSNIIIKDNLMYLYLFSMAGESKAYLIHMDTTEVSILEGYIDDGEYESSAISQIKKEINNDSTFQETFKKIFRSYEVIKELNNDKDENEMPYEEKDVVFEIVHAYDLGYKTVLEFSISAHGYLGWRDEYTRIGVGYFIADKYSLGDMGELYRVNFFE